MVLPTATPKTIYRVLNWPQSHDSPVTPPVTALGTNFQQHHTRTAGHLLPWLHTLKFGKQWQPPCTVSPWEEREDSRDRGVETLTYGSFSDLFFFFFTKCLMLDEPSRHGSVPSRTQVGGDRLFPKRDSRCPGLSRSTTDLSSADEATPGAPRPRGDRDAARLPLARTLPGLRAASAAPFPRRGPFSPKGRGRTLTWPRRRRSPGGGRCCGERAPPGTAAAASGPGPHRLPAPGALPCGDSSAPSQGD